MIRAGDRVLIIEANVEGVVKRVDHRVWRPHDLFRVVTETPVRKKYWKLAEIRLVS